MSKKSAVDHALSESESDTSESTQLSDNEADENEDENSESEISDGNFSDNGESELESEINNCPYEKNKKKYDNDTYTANLEEGIIKKRTFIVAPKDRITRPVLTKYERVRILSERRQQLTLGAKPMVAFDGNLSPTEISNLELQEKVIPFIIVRQLPSGQIEHWHLNELKIIN